AGEGGLFSADARREVAAAFVGAARGKLQVAVHCGAQTTRETAALAEHAAAAGADAVAVIAPPYFALGEDELLGHFEAAAHACAPLPFYLYEFEARSGYAIPLAVLGFRGVPVGPEVRRPLRGLTEIECAEVGRIVAAWSA